MDNHIHHHVHYEGGGTLADVLTALQRIEQKLGDLADIEGQQKKVDDFAKQLQEQHADTSAFVDDNKPKE